MSGLPPSASSMTMILLFRSSGDRAASSLPVPALYQTSTMSAFATAAFISRSAAGGGRRMTLLISARLASELKISGSRPFETWVGTVSKGAKRVTDVTASAAEEQNQLSFVRTSPQAGG